jgi:hypothetical protein
VTRVLERAKRTDFRFEKSVGEALVVVEALGIGSAGTVGLDAGPRDGEAVTSQVLGFEERDVFFKAMVGITGDVPSCGPLHFAGSMREAVPDGFAFAVFGPGTLDLISGGGGAANELLGKLERRELRLRIK